MQLFINNKDWIVNLRLIDWGAEKSGSGRRQLFRYWYGVTEKNHENLSGQPTSGPRDSTSYLVKTR
jgi:hypothetical protein